MSPKPQPRPTPHCAESYCPAAVGQIETHFDRGDALRARRRNRLRRMAPGVAEPNSDLWGAIFRI
jgi:hypothetical protein